MNREEALFFLNELLDSDDSTDDSEDERFHIDVVNEINRRRPKIDGFVEDVVDNFSEAEFRENFRMYRATFEHILQLIENKISTNIVERGRRTISPKVQLLLSIWYFSTPDSYRSICCRFNVGKATGLRAVRRVTEALLSISPQIIVWPNGEYLNDVKRGFHEMGFPNTIGAIDGSYIPIPLPKDHGISYICRKNFPAIILQGVCDHRLLFTHCYAGEVGSVHDARVLRNSEVWTFLNEEAEYFPDDTHIIGDKAYPCLPSLLPPYKNNGHLTRQQLNFNFKLSSARSTIERAFGLLKKRMRCLKFFDVRCLEWTPKYIIACCVLHNICIMQNDILDLDINDEHLVGEEEEENVIVDRVERENRRRGLQKRDALSLILPI